MQNDYKRYFWDGQIESFSEEYQLMRILEYASFPDLVNYPFDKLQKNINKVDINSLRTSTPRKRFIEVIKPYVSKSKTWEESLEKYLKDCFEYSNQ